MITKIYHRLLFKNHKVQVGQVMKLMKKQPRTTYTGVSLQSLQHLQKRYVNIDESHGKNLYYYFIESERDSSKDPVVLWMNGGPGCSSFDGFVYEHGPFNFKAAKTRGGLPKLHLNPYAWSKADEVDDNSRENIDRGYLSDGPVRSKKDGHERKKGVPWTSEEHRTFLEGLKKLGKGDWRGISRVYVTTRTPAQVASHAQKYFLRQTAATKKKR